MGTNNPYMQRSDDEWYAMSTPTGRHSSGIVVIKKNISNLCFRGSHENGNGIRKCHGFVGKCKSKKCECNCHGTD